MVSDDQPEFDSKVYFVQCYLFVKDNQYCIDQGIYNRVSVQGVKSLSGHFASLCRGFYYHFSK